MRQNDVNVSKTIYSSFAYHVIERIVDRFTFRISDIEQFAEAKFGFEDWCIAESFAACRVAGQWYVEQNPRYRLEEVDSNDAGDLKVYNSPHEADFDRVPAVFFEFAVARSRNAQPNRVGLREKIIGDVRQLERLTEWTDSWPILMVLDVTTDDTVDDPDWLVPLLELRNATTFFRDRIVLRFPNRGQLRLYFFGVRPSSPGQTTTPV